MATTTIEVGRETWRQLNIRKEPGESFDDVIQALMSHHVREAQPDEGPQVVDHRVAEGDQKCANYIPDRGGCDDDADYVLSVESPSGKVQDVPFCATHANISEENHD